MRILVIIMLALTGLGAHAQPDRTALLDAWKSRMTELGGTLQPQSDEAFFLTDDSLPYEGKVEIVSALIRSAPEQSYGDIVISHSGIVEFRLEDLPTERTASQLYYYWLADRQNFHFLSDTQEWISQARYNQLLQNSHSTSYSALSWIVNWGFWIVVLGLVIWLALFLGRSQKKAKSLMSDSADINNLARENIEKSAELQNEMAGLARKNAQLMEDNNVLLRQILESVSRSG